MAGRNLALFVGAEAKGGGLMNIGKLLGVAIVLTMTGNNSALGYCSQPSFYGTTPSAPGTYARPSVPYCLQGFSYTRRHSCEPYEIDSFINEMNDYIRKLNAFANESRSFAEEAIDFANSASEYAKCERDELVKEVE